MIDPPDRPCVGCGMCCSTAPCAVGYSRHGAVAPCPDLVEREGRHWCRVVLEDPSMAEVIGIGTGCCQPLFNPRRQKILRRLLLVQSKP